MTTHRTAPPLADRALAERVRDGAAVGHPEVLRHRWRRWTTSSASGWGSRTSTRPRSIIEAGVESLREGRTHYTSNSGTLELRKALAGAPRAAVRRRLRPEARAADHGRARRRRSTSRSARRATPATRSSCTSRRTSPTCRRSCSPAAPPSTSRPASRTTSRSTRRRSRRRSRRARRRSSSATRATRPAPSSRTRSRRSSRRIAERHDLLVYSDEIYDRLAYGDVPPPGVLGAAGHERADDPDGRLLEGVRDDRLADRLDRRAGGDHRGHRSRSTSTRS